LNFQNLPPFLGFKTAKIPLLDPDPDQDSGSGSRRRFESGSNPDPDPKHWKKYINNESMIEPVVLQQIPCRFKISSSNFVKKILPLTPP
jgi:hypothetical protein